MKARFGNGRSVINFHKGGDRALNTEGNLVKNAAKTRMNLSS